MSRPDHDDQSDAYSCLSSPAELVSKPTLSDGKWDLVLL